MRRMTDEQLDAEVLFQLKQHVGRSRPIGRWELVAKILGPVVPQAQNDNNPADRMIRKSVERLRKQGVLICDMGDGIGRYLAATVEEYRLFRAMYGSRAYEVIATIQEMDKAAEDEFPDLLQPRLL